MKLILIVTLLVIKGIASGKPTKEDTSCHPRDYGNGGTVCVCNSSYCDTISPPERLENTRQFFKFTSNKAGLRLESEIGDFETWSSGESDFSDVSVDPNRQFQTIIGWGGAFTDSTGINIKSLDEQTQEHFMNSYFSESGIEYSLCRVPMGGTDFSTKGYSYDDGDVDENLTNWQLAQEDFEYKIPFIKKALSLTNDNLRLFTATWTAPKWMKNNNDYNGLGFLIDTYYQTWANYFIKFLDAYKEQGISFWGISTGNEPSLGYVPLQPINSVGWTPFEKSQWIANNLGPTIRNSDHADIKIMTLDDQRMFVPWYVEEELADEVTRNFIDGIAVHWYMDDYFPASALTDLHKLFSDKFILATEACVGDKPWDEAIVLGSWERGERYAKSIIEDVSNWVSGWVDWNMALDLTGGPTYINNNVDSPIIVNASAGEFYKQPMFYSLAHFSKFVPRDSVRVDSWSFDSQVMSAAFKRPDGGVVVVILNMKEEGVLADIVDKARNLKAELELSEQSITTILYWG